MELTVAARSRQRAYGAERAAVTDTVTPAAKQHQS